MYILLLVNLFLAIIWGAELAQELFNADKWVYYSALILILISSISIIFIQTIDNIKKTNKIVWGISLIVLFQILTLIILLIDRSMS